VRACVRAMNTHFTTSVASSSAPGGALVKACARGATHARNPAGGLSRGGWWGCPGELLTGWMAL